MKYEEIRAIAKDGDILFLVVNKKDWMSTLTSYFTKSPYTHAAFLFWYKDRLMLVESTTHGGIRIVQASTYWNREIDLLPSPVPWNTIENTALSKSGTTTYGWFSAIYIGLREFMFTHFNISLPVNNNNRNKACSEFVSEVLGLDDVDISPGVLYKILS